MFGYLDGYEGRRMNADRSIDYEEGWTQGMFDYNFGRVCLYGTK